MSLLESLHAEDTCSAQVAAFLVEFGQLWSRGLVDPGRLWDLFDISEMFMCRPGYFGAPLFGVSGRLVSPVFSTEIGLAEFMMGSAAVGPESGADGYDWVCLTGAQFFQLPVRARYLAIDPGSSHEATVDLSQRADIAVRAGDGWPLLVDLDLAWDGGVDAFLGESAERGGGGWW